MTKQHSALAYHLSVYLNFYHRDSARDVFDVDSHPCSFCDFIEDLENTEILLSTWRRGM